MITYERPGGEGLAGGVFPFANVTVWGISNLRVIYGSKNKFLGKFFSFQ